MGLKRKCFGTSEFCLAGMCKSCRSHKECGDFVREKYGNEIINLPMNKRRRLMR